MRRVPTKRLSPAMLSLVAVLVACGNPAGNLPVGSYERGEVEFQNDYYMEAIEDLKLFIRRNPQHERADDAQFMIGNSYYEMEDYPLAAVELEILRNDYPNSEKGDDAFYLEGMCYAKQVPDYRLDQTITERAIEQFTRFLAQYPNSEHREAALETLNELWLQMDKKRLANARNYRKWGRQSAAYRTVNNVLTDRPNSPLRPDMLILKGELAIELKRFDEGSDALNEVIDRYPDSGMKGDAEHLLRKLEKQQAKDAG